MAPIERFEAAHFGEGSGNGRIDFEDLESVVEKVCQNWGLLMKDQGEDEQTLQQFRVYSIGIEGNAESVVLIGNSAEFSDRLSDLNTTHRPHRLIANLSILQEVKRDLATMVAKVAPK